MSRTSRADRRLRSSAVGLVTDSNAQLPEVLVDRYGVEVVPLTVTVDGVAYLEGEELDADAFYRLFEKGTPSVSTSQPSPGRLAQTYRTVSGRGARQILSVHVGSAVSGTVNAARLAAETSPVPVRVVDTGTASFGVAACLWEAAEALALGASVEQAAGVAEQVGATMGNVFVVRALDLARAGGRLKASAAGDDAGPGDEGIPVMTLRNGVMEVVGRAGRVDEAAEVMAEWVRRHARSHGAAGATAQLRVGVGVADRAAVPLRDALAERLADLAEVGETVDYRVGPSVGAHTGPGTVGAMYYPSPAWAF